MNFFFSVSIILIRIFVLDTLRPYVQCRNRSASFYHHFARASNQHINAENGVYDVKVIFQLKGTFSAQAAVWAILQHFYSEMVTEVHCRMCAHAQADQILLRMSSCFPQGKILPFQPMFRNTGERRFFRKATFRHLFATFSPAFKGTSSGFLYSQAFGVITGFRLIAIEPSERDFGSSFPKPVGRVINGSRLIPIEPSKRDFCIHQ
jgi:hypothetical protein